MIQYLLVLFATQFRFRSPLKASRFVSFWYLLAPKVLNFFRSHIYFKGPFSLYFRLTRFLPCQKCASPVQPGGVPVQSNSSIPAQASE
jgi:hypothetical protein